MRPIQAVTIRSAQRSDLDAITTIALMAYRSGEQWPYRFPYAWKYLDDHWRYSNLRLANFMDNVESGAFVVKVAEMPIDEDRSTMKVVAYSVWQMPGDFAGKSLPKDNFERRDANPARMKAFRDSTTRAKKELFNSRFGDRQLNLVMLATLPEYQRRGAGTMLLQWGIDKADAEGLAITLFAGPSAQHLYSRSGFEVVGNVHTQVEGEEAAIDLPAMAYMPKVLT
ncbi:hypothetical protein VTN00DRAFT_7219 [Thermoascus crustaceus]|uniref:uncharacterized protein n=1 Tax=Thermoascus crustaceus TaxID=5088 RepID=UPI0037443DAC